MMKEFLTPGKNCWCLEKAERVAFLVDGQAIFEAFQAAARQAEESLLIIGWDFDSRVKIKRTRSPEETADSNDLGAFLEELVAARENLQIHILIWDFPVIYAADREPLPIFNLDWKTNRRIQCTLDSEHPIGACHHQKMIVIDNRLALVGGFDLSNRRWDTPEHLAEDRRRTDPLGETYPPFHDVQVLVQGPLVGKLGDLARQRWCRATGTNLPVPPSTLQPAWPPTISPDLCHVSVAIARTEPPYKNRPAITEVQQLFEDTIAAAEQYIYIENQYLTSRVIQTALLASLRQKNGPEIVILLPKSNAGWLEENTMGRLRLGVLQSLWKGDLHGRLGVYCPVIQGQTPDPSVEVRVHAKVMIVDDRFVRVGSANLNNRSMGLDTECDLALEIPAGEAGVNSIVALRNRLLAEHLGTTPDVVGKTISDEHSLGKAIETLRGHTHTLVELRPEFTADAEAGLVEGDMLDPERPVQLDRMMDKMLIAETEGSDSGSEMLKLGITVLAIVAMISVWWFTPLRNYLDVNTLVTWAQSFRDSRLDWLYILLAYVIGGSVCFPVTVMIVATSMLFAPLEAFGLSLGGSLVSAVLTYTLGYWLGRGTIRTVAGGRLNKISKQIARKGLLAVGTLRLLPIAPFTLINLVAGASHIRFRDYLLGTLLGMLPGIASLTLLTDRLKAVLIEPGLWNGLLLLGLLLFVGLGAYYIQKRLITSERSAGSDKKAE